MNEKYFLKSKNRSNLAGKTMYPVNIVMIFVREAILKKLTKIVDLTSQ